MNQYTQQFLNNDFPGYQPRESFDKVSSDMWFAKSIPFVHVNTEFDLRSTYQECLDQDHVFKICGCAELLNKKFRMLNSEWYRNPHKHLHYELVIQGTNEKHADVIGNPDGDFSQGIDYALPAHPHMFQDLQQQFQAAGLPFKRLWISKLAPGGWLYPHRDFKPLNLYPVLNYFWMPLHHSKSTIKIWPHGYARIPLGDLMLFNHQYFMHAASNDDEISRYVLLGTLDHEKIDSKRTGWIRDRLRQQWYN